MDRRDIVIGVVILIILAIAILLLRRDPSVPQSQNNPSPTPSVESQLEESFRVDIPDDAEKVELKDVANVNGAAIATRSWENNRYTATILADLPDPESGFYQAWIGLGGANEEGATLVSLGQMWVSKGGWMIEYQSNTNYSDYDTIVVTQESASDSRPEKRILEGSF